MPDIEINDLNTIGIVSDAHAFQLPPEAWTRALNMRMAEEGVERLLGWEQTLGTLPILNDSFTKVLLEFNGVDGSTTITDTAAGASGAHTWTAAGGAQLDTAAFKYGGASLLCTAAGDYVSMADHADLAIGSSDVTIECFFNTTALTGTVAWMFGQTDNFAAAAATSFRCQRSSGDKIAFAFYEDDASFHQLVSTTSFTDAVNPGWHHLAAVIHNGTFTLYIDGVSEGGTSLVVSVLNSLNALSVGRLGEFANNTWRGWIDGFKISIGVARYTANFSPPAFESLSLTQAAPHFAMPIRTSAATFWLYASLDKIFAYDGSTYANITRQTASIDVDYTGSETREINGTLLGGTPIINNGTDIPQYWTGIALSSKMSDLSNWPSTLRAKVVRAFGPFLVAINVTKSGTNLPHMVKWSHPADPGTLPSSWDETDPTLDAGEFELPDVDAGILLDALPLSETLYLYKESSVWKMRFVGGRDIFSTGQAAWLTTTGILAPRCVCVTGDGKRHVWASQDDILWHDGNQVRSLLTNRRRKELFNAIDTSNYLNCFIFTNPLRSEVWFCYPTSGNTHPDKAMIFNYQFGGEQWPTTDADGITFRNATIGAIQGASDELWSDGTDIWDDDTGPWSQLARRRVVLCGTDAGKFYKLDNGATRDGTPFTGTLQRTGLSVTGKKRNGEWVVDHYVNKLVRRLWPKISGGAVNVRLGTQELVDGPITWSPVAVHDPSANLYADPGPIGGAAIGVEFSSDVAFRISGYSLELQTLGRFRSGLRS